MSGRYNSIFTSPIERIREETVDSLIQNFLAEYLEIEQQPRTHRTRNQLLTQLLARYPDLEQTSFAELALFLDRLKEQQIALRMPLFTALVYPVLEREISRENPQALLLLLQHLDLLHKYALRYRKQEAYSERALIRHYLALVPDDRAVLMRQRALLALDLEYSLHELPTGVLFGINGATADDCLELLELLEEYVSTCQKLQIDCDADRRYYAMHFQGYRDYLLHPSLYTDYRDYMRQHRLALRNYRAR